MTSPLSRLEHGPARLLRRLGQRDRGLMALRRAGRAAIVMPAMFAFCDKVIGDAQIATFAAFGSFALLMLVDFGGPLRDRLQAQAALAATGAVFVCLGTLASREAWLAAVAMAAVGFGTLFAGVVSSVLAGASTSVLLSFILPVAAPGGAEAIPGRLAGWLLAGAVALPAVVLLWPAPRREPLRDPAAEACRCLSARLTAEVARGREGGDDPAVGEAVARSEAAVAALRAAFLATPYRPSGLSTAARALVGLVDEVIWLSVILDDTAGSRHRRPMAPTVRRVKTAAAVLLDHGRRS
jgi:uncharacterized membrane protein YccC